jgi:hypothetical protein
MNPYQNAFRVIIGRYKNDFQWNEDQFENEDGPEQEEETEPENVVEYNTKNNPPLQEAA